MARRKALVILPTVTWLLAGFPALSHGWYPLSCCSDRDCRELAEESGEVVTETPEGWRLWDGRLVARGRAAPSQDQKFHLCETRAKSILCFFAPPGSS
jgi:hypothetical protein